MGQLLGLPGMSVYLAGRLETREGSKLKCLA